MWNQRKKTEKIRYLPPDSIYSNPRGARRKFSPERVEALSRSISRYGILQPLTVQKRCGEYELICGEMRLRAAKLLEMKTVPCRVLNVSAKLGAEIALVENLQRTRLDSFEEGAAADRLLKNFRYFQGELADRLGQSPSALSAKLRLLRFTPEERDLIEKNDLTPRHADALLHLRDPAMRLFALNYMIENALPPDHSEELCSTLSTHPEEFVPALRPHSSRRESPVRRLVVKDVRIFINSVDRAILSIREAGFSVEAEKEECEEFISYSIRVPKEKEFALK
ncbi:MAG: ParB/RepB/Spo0J family partition protein [Clostridia bacterium]|nr:ParB/RepB/Spo0J family partition protein [Clostridia bacterium]